MRVFSFARLSHTLDIERGQCPTHHYGPPTNGGDLLTRRKIMPFVCLRRTDIPNSILQVTDLWPNKSQYNPSVGPEPQGPRYMSAPVTNTPVLTNAAGVITFTAAKSGLAAYILANVQAAGALGIACTPTQANNCAAAIIAAMRAGSAMTLSAINALLVASAGAGSELTNAGGSLSTGTVTDVLRILSGATYTVPAGTQVQAAGVFTAQASAATWNTANFNFTTYSDILVMDSSFYISLAQGKLAGFTAATFSYKGTPGAALVAYDDAGGVL